MPKYKTNKQLWNQLMKCEKNGENGLNGHLLMVHFGTFEGRPEKFYDLLPKMIDTLQKKGYRFVSLEEAIGLRLK